MTKDDRAKFTTVAVIHAMDLFPLLHGLLEQTISLARHSRFVSGRPPPQRIQPAMQESGMCRQVLLDQFADMVAIHVHGQVAFFSQPYCGLSILVRKPSEITRRPDRCVWRCSAEVLEGGEQLLARLPYGFVREDQPQHRTITLHQRALVF